MLAGGLIIFGNVHKRGDQIELTAERIEGNRDRLGRSWLDDLSEEGQLARWGEVRVGVGPWPEDLPAWSYGDPLWQMAREQACRAAWRHEDAATRRQALAEVEQIYGPARPTSRTVNSSPDPSIRAAAEQDRLLREGGVRLKSRFQPGERVNP